MKKNNSNKIKGIGILALVLIFSLIGITFAVDTTNNLICENEVCACDLTNAHWDTSNAVAGQNVSLSVDGTNCNGKIISFEIKKDNGVNTDDFVANLPNKTFSGNSVTNTWKVIAPFNGDANPKYSFIAKVSDSSETAKSFNLYVSIPETCGNGVLDENEQCDDENTNNNDACRNNCQLPSCGDEVKDSNEQCDDGNLVDGDGCSSECTIAFGVTTRNAPPKIILCNHRIVYDDATEPGRISEDGTELIERINNYAFEGEQIQWKVLVIDKNGKEKINDVYVVVNDSIEANCVRLTDTQVDRRCANTFDPTIMAYYMCTLSVETPESDNMYGEKWITIEAEDMDGIKRTMDENEFWFLNPEVALGIEGEVSFEGLREGTSGYSKSVLIRNDADADSGVMLDMFISGTDFYDSKSSGAMCSSANTLSLDEFSYYAVNGAYSTRQDMEEDFVDGDRDVDAEGYVNIEYGIGFNDPNPFYNNNEILQAQKVGPYYTANLLAPGAEMTLTFRLDLPEPCNGDFDEGQIYFWGEAI